MSKKVLCHDHDIPASDRKNSPQTLPCLELFLLQSGPATESQAISVKMRICHTSIKGSIFSRFPG